MKKICLLSAMLAGIALLPGCVSNKIEIEQKKEAEQKTEQSVVFDALLKSMVECPAGSFVMGSPDDEPDRREDENQHRVTLTKPFWIGKCEVTQAQYDKVMVSNPSEKVSDSDRPVVNVTWYDAMAFCEKLNALTEGARPEGYKFSLPTEAQWEYACRAGTTGAYAGDLDTMGWYCNNSNKGMHSVGQKQPNAWGIYDMHGNVYEWCSDLYRVYAGNATDPSTGSASGQYRIRRGGSWDTYARYSRSAGRYSFDSSCGSEFIGFRIALVPVQ